MHVHAAIILYTLQVLRRYSFVVVVVVSLEVFSGSAASVPRLANYDKLGPYSTHIIRRFDAGQSFPNR